MTIFYINVGSSSDICWCGFLEQALGLAAYILCMGAIVLVCNLVGFQVHCMNVYRNGVWRCSQLLGLWKRCVNKNDRSLVGNTV
jgi:hypothetical protein